MGKQNQDGTSEINAEEVKEDSVSIQDGAGKEGFLLLDESENSARSYSGLVIKALILLTLRMQALN